jgi:hypothetical protein
MGNRQSRQSKQISKKQSLKAPVKPCHTLTDAESAYYLSRYSDVLKSCGNNGRNYQCARNHYKNVGCKEGRTYTIPPSLMQKCSVPLTDERTACYKENNKIPMDSLTALKTDWATYGCLHNLNTNCPIDNEMDTLRHQIKIADNTIVDLGKDFQEYADKADSAIANILQMEVTSLPFVMQQVRIQNEKLRTQAKDKQNHSLAYSQSATYQQRDYENLAYINVWLFWTYYVIFLAFVIILVFFKGGSQNLRIFFIVLFATYPFWISYLQNAIEWFWTYISAFVGGKVFVQHE